MTGPVRDLTPMERLVAALVAAGMTNRAIGEQLALSRHTVDYHLRQAYRKLNISSRAELAARLESQTDFTMFDGMFDGVVVLEPLWTANEITDFRIVYANAAAVDLDERQISGLVGQRWLQRYRAHDLIGRYANAFRSGEVFEARNALGDGTIEGRPAVCRYDVRTARHANVLVATFRVWSKVLRDATPGPGPRES